MKGKEVKTIPYTHRLRYGNSDWVFFFIRHLGSNGWYSEFVAARVEGIYANHSRSLKSLFRWVREWEVHLKEKKQ